MLIFGKKINLSVLFWILFYLLVFIVLIKNSYSYLDPDFGWHLKAGQHISVNKEVSRENFYNYTYSGEWINHEWLIDWISFEFFDNYGYLLLSIIFALVIVALLVIANIYTRRFFLKSSSVPIAIFQLIGLYASLPHFGVRMQEFSALFLFLEIVIISVFRRRSNWRQLIWLIPLFLVWVNFHGSFLFGLVIFVFWIFVEITEKILSQFEKVNLYVNLSQARNNRLLYTSLFFLLILPVTLVNPYGEDLYSFLSEYKNTAYLSLIQEWLPLYYPPISYLKILYLGLLVGAWILYIYDILYKKNKNLLDLWEFCLFILFLFISFKSKRNFPLLFIVTFPFFINILSGLLDWEFFRKIFLNKRLSYFLSTCLILSTISLSASTYIKKDPFAGFCDSYPCGAVDFLQKNIKYDHYQIFNEYSWGGYLIWVYPEKPLFIDGRLPQASFAGKTFVEEYQDFFKKNIDKGEKLSEYGIKLILLRANDEPIDVGKFEKFFLRINDNKLIPNNYLKEYLDKSSDWQIVYRDDVSVIYARE